MISKSKFTIWNNDKIFRINFEVLFFDRDIKNYEIYESSKLRLTTLHIINKKISVLIGNEIAEFLDIVSVITSQGTEKLNPDQEIQVDSIIESVIKSSIN